MMGVAVTPDAIDCIVRGIQWVALIIGVVWVGIIVIFVWMYKFRRW